MAAAVETPDFDLDSVEREYPKGKKPQPPFKVNVAGRVIVLRDPAEIDWQDLAQIENPLHFLKFAFRDDEDGEADRTHVREAKIPGWKFGKLIDSYLQHFGVEEPGNGRGSLI